MILKKASAVLLLINLLGTQTACSLLSSSRPMTVEIYKFNPSESRIERKTPLSKAEQSELFPNEKRQVFRMEWVTYDKSAELYNPHVLSRYRVIHEEYLADLLKRATAVEQ